jgi:D-alanyl-D-alanine carboxypeptidase
LVEIGTMNRLSAAVLALVSLVLVGCSAAVPGARQDALGAAPLVAELQSLLESEVVANPSLPGELLHVHAPAHGIDVSLAAGVFDRTSGRRLEPHHGFRVASVTKTFTAAAILRLYEDGRIRLDGPIAEYLPSGYVAVLSTGGYDPSRITVRQLLAHTSGIYDYATDPRYPAAAFADPNHRWTRMEQVRVAMAWGSPRFAPGGGFHYSDTGYVLLGEMLERVTGEPLPQALRTLVGFDRLGLEDTYLETLEPAPPGAGELSHPYFGEADVVGLDPSVDLYGGGGLVSSVADLARFYRALLRGEVFRDPSTLRAMLTVPPTNQRAPGGAYALGIARSSIGGEICWGHTGFWGTAAYHCPVPDVTMVRHTNQAQPAAGFVFRDLHDRIATLLGMSR